LNIAIRQTLEKQLYLGPTFDSGFMGNSYDDSLLTHTDFSHLYVMGFKSRLANKGPELSKAIAGVMNWGQWGAKLDTSDMARLIEQCVENEITSFDHADIYGGYTTEADFGKAFETTSLKRDQIQLITKCGICYPCDERPEFGIKSYNTTKQYILDCVDKSLANLKTKYIDVLLIHRPSPLMDLHEISEAFGALKAAGKVLHFGVSNFSTTQFNDLHSHVPLVTNQIEASVLQLEAFTNGTFIQCQRYHFKPMIWSPLSGGKLFEESEDFDFVKRRGRLKDVADKYEWTLDEMAYLFLLHHPVGMFPVIGSSKLDRILLAKQCYEKTLTNEQWFEIWIASTGHRVP